MDDQTQLESAVVPVEWSAWRARMAAARRRRDDASALWQENVTRRRGALTEVDPGATKVPVNKDWPLTKSKMALLYSQQPTIRITTADPSASGAASAFASQVNDAMRQASVGTAIEEELADVINASGISAVVMSCEKLTEWRDMPVVDVMTLPPEMQMAVQAGAVAIPTMPVRAVTDIAYPCRRMSPTALLVPAEFTGSNYDQARWLGYEDGFTWEQAKTNLGLTDEQKDQVVGPDKRAGSTTTLNTDMTKFQDTEVVTFQELFYWRRYYHADETSFFALQRLVFVNGLNDPVINEPFQGQKRLPDGRIVGVKRNPIQVLTLTYISDDCLPPSDSTISRFQISELEDSRADMRKQRKHSIPVRWYDTNRVSPGVRTLLENGTYQGLVPIQGPGDRAIGEVASAAFPPERGHFDAMIDAEITDQWTVGGNQQGQWGPGERTASEANIIQKNFQTRVGHERSKVERHYVAIAEVMGALMAVHGHTALPAEALDTLTFTIRVDSTVLLDAQARIDQLMKFLNMTVQSGFVNPKPVIAEIAELSGLDPSKVIVDPKPKPPEPISISIGGPEDISNPLFLATLMATNQAPTPEHLAAAIKLLNVAMQAEVPVLPPMKQTERPNPADPSGTLPHGQAFPGWETASRIERRSEDGGA